MGMQRGGDCKSGLEDVIARPFTLAPLSNIDAFLIQDGLGSLPGRFIWGCCWKQMREAAGHGVNRDALTFAEASKLPIVAADDRKKMQF